MKKQHLAVLAALIIALIALVFFTLQSENQKSSGSEATSETATDSGTDTDTDTDTDTGTDTEADTDSSGGESVATVDYEKSYAQKCSTCHAADFTGGVGPDISKIGSQMTKEEIEKIILDGVGIMPPGQLKGEEAAAVAEWLAGMK